MTSITAVAATEPLYDLGEGILWDDRAGRVRWVDITSGRVLSAMLDGDRLTNIEAIEFGQTTGAVALADDGGLLVAAARGLAVVAPDGTVSLGPDLLGDRVDVRFNDGIVDPQGRFLIGTLSLADAENEQVLLRVSPDGSVEVLRDGIGLSNGLGFSPDGSLVYHVDTGAGTVSSHSYGEGAFDRDEPWRTVVADLPAHPDGMTVDSRGDLWIALWGGASVQRHSATGELVETVSVDAAQVSCPAFIGPDLDILGITTAQEGLDSFSDQAGAMFLARPAASAPAEHRWAGSTTTPYWTLA